MPFLTIPESGLSLGNFPATPSKSAHGVPEVFGLTLNDGVIEEMIKCVQSGKPIQLSLGEHPSILYGTKIQNLSTTSDPFTHELYRSTNSDSSSFDMDSRNNSNKSGYASSHTVFAGKIQRNLLGIKGLAKPKPTKTITATSTPKSKLESSTSAADAAVAALQNSLASENAKKQENTIKYIKDGAGLPVPGRRGGAAAKPANKSKFLAQNNRSLASDTARSMPSSPALSGVGSPSLGPTSVPLSQQQAEHAKAARKPVIHLLAVEPLTEKALREKVSNVSANDLKNALQKVGDLNDSTGKWELRRAFYKELDVWTFKYDSTDDRQRAIDNAVKQYDKMRLSASDAEWDRLLVKSERGTGKCLSKLQAQIALASVAKAPKINVEKADGSGRDTPSGKDEDALEDKKVSKVKGESMARSNSQPPNTKAKKVSEKEAQAKRLLSKNPSKAAAKVASKPAPAKKQPPAKAATNPKVLSSEFVNESDEDDDHPPPPPPKPAAKSVKRSREEDEVETSDSSIPLSKKIKKTPAVTNHRVSDASQSSRTTNASQYSTGSSKTKNNSPQKSSPLASSPPTNASEFGDSSGGRTSSSTSPVHASTKNSRSPIHKRHQKSSSVTSSSSSGSTRYLKPEVTDLARKFKSFYPKYEALHKEIVLMGLGGQRDKEKEQDLLEMHSRLEQMKKDILKGIVEVNH